MLKLIKLEECYRPQLNDMMEEWLASGEKLIPYSIRRADYRDFSAYLAALDAPLGADPVPNTTWFCLDTESERLVGAVSIRHELKGRWLLDGGHIGDGVRPSERRKGIATKMIALALEKCRELGIPRVLMVCHKDNIGSAKSIIANGGVLENEIVLDGELNQRYWITL